MTASLYQLRRAYTDLLRAQESLAKADITLPHLDAEVERLAGLTVVVLLPCILCREPVESQHKVTDASYPMSALCGSCNARLDVVEEATMEVYDLTCDTTESGVE